MLSSNGGGLLVALIGCSVWWWTRRRQTLLAGPKPAPSDASPAAQHIVEPVEPLVEPPKAPVEPDEPPKVPVTGYLVAAVHAPEDFGGFIPEEGDGPPSTDSDEDEDELGASFKPKRDETHVSFIGEKKTVREASFRRRSAEKIERAQEVKIRSGSLTSHLITPAQHNRRLELSGKAVPSTVGFAPRRLQGMAEGSAGARRSESPANSFGDLSAEAVTKRRAGRKTKLDNLSAISSAK